MDIYQKKSSEESVHRMLRLLLLLLLLLRHIFTSSQKYRQGKNSGQSLDLWALL